MAIRDTAVRKAPIYVAALIHEKCYTQQNTDHRVHTT